MHDFSYIHLTHVFRARHNLPDRGYPIPIGLLGEIAANDDPALELLMFGLQERSQYASKRWKQYELAIDRLAELVANGTQRSEIVASGSHWWLELGPVNLKETIVTIQRGNKLISALSRRIDGRLRVSVFRALDAKSLGYLISLGQVPDPEYGVAMRENNWEYALDSSAGMGNFYAAESGSAYLSFWEKGIGNASDGSVVPVFKAYEDLTARQPEWTAVQLAVHDRYTT